MTNTQDGDLQISVSCFGCVIFANLKCLLLVIRDVIPVFLGVRHWKHYKNKGLGHPASSAVFFLKIAFLHCTN